MLYYPVTNVMSATHWQPTEKRYEDDIMIGKIYHLTISPMDGEPCIYDDAGIDSTCYLWNEGKFLKEVKSTVIKITI